MTPTTRSDRERLADQLGQCLLFAALDADTLDGLAGAAVLRTLSAGQMLWQQGQAADTLAVVLSGRLDVSRTTADGERLLLRVLSPGQAVGLSVISGEAPSADLVAREPTRIATIRGAVLRRLFARRPELALKALAHLGGLVRQLTDELEELRFQDLDARVLNWVTRQARGRREIRFTHQEIADQVGATRPNVSRALKRLEVRGAIRCRRGRIEVGPTGC